jgi:phenylacetate-CoA ligase
MTALRGAIATKIIDPIVWKLKRMPVGARLEQFRAEQWDDAETVERRQADRLRGLLAHAATRVPFYRERVSGLTAADIEADPWGSLAAFPILEKEDIRHHLDDLTCDMGRGKMVERTGGSTGLPLVFYRDRYSQTASFASTQLFYDWAGVERGERRIRLWGSPRDFAAQRSPAMRFLNFFHDRTLLDAFAMGDAQMREYIRFLHTRPPVAFEGYTTAVYNLAEFADRRGLAVPTPRAVILGGSTLHPHMRDKIEAVFHAPVFDYYGSHEVGVTATECDRHNGLHVFGETSVAELVDRNDRPAPVGELGELIVTQLWEYTMPFIRYRTGDQAVMSDRVCDCGRSYPLLDHVAGRSNDCFVRADGGIVVPEIMTRLFGLVYNTGDVRSFQAVQEAIDHIRIRVALEPTSGGLPPDAQEGIASRILETMGAACRIEFEFVDEIEPAPSGKHFYLISKVAREAAPVAATSGPAPPERTESQ